MDLAHIGLLSSAKPNFLDHCKIMDIRMQKVKKNWTIIIIGLQVVKIWFIRLIFGQTLIHG